MAKENKAIKYRLYPNAEQQVLFAKTFGCTRFIYNKMLGDKIEHYNLTKTKLNNTPAQYKDKFPWLKEVDSLALANAQLNLQTAYNNFFRNPKTGFPKFKSKRSGKLSYATNNQNGTVSLQQSGIKLPKLGVVKAKLHRLPDEHWLLKSATVTQTPTGKYYCSVLFEYEAEPKPMLSPTKDNTIGLDYSSHDFYVDSNGMIANHGHWYRKTQQKLARAQRKLSRKKQNSNNRNKQKHKVAVIQEKIAMQRKDFCHQMSRKIANSYDFVCVENLNLHGIAGSLKLGKSTHDNGFGFFRSMLSYKLADKGGALITIDKWYASSKTCHECGYVNKDLTLMDRKWICPSCGAHHDRDYNAALNIRDEGIRQFNAQKQSA